MTEFNELAQRYVALWNEPDKEVRRKAVAELFADNGRHTDEHRDIQGHAAIEERVAIAYQQWVAEGNYTFRSVGNANGFGNVVRFNWDMVLAGSTQPAAIGFDFLVLDADGRIAVDYQFIDPAPAS